MNSEYLNMMGVENSMKMSSVKKMQLRNSEFSEEG